MQLGYHIDEPATLLAIDMVASKGVPLFPSDVLYLQGAFISYISAPFAWIFQGESLLRTLQTFNIGISLIVVVLVYSLAFHISKSPFPALVARLGVALDPSLIAWSIWVRPYGLLTLETTALAYCFLVLVQKGPDARLRNTPVRHMIVALFWVGTFTHIGVWLVFPAMVVISIMLWDIDLIGKYQDLSRSAAVAVMAPLTVTFLGALVGAGSSNEAGEGGAGFVGDHIISVSRIMNPNMSLKVWERNFQGSQVGELMPFYLVTLCALLLGVYLHVTNRQQLMERRAILSLMSLYFTPILLVTLLATGDAQPRYLLHVLPIGYVLIALGLWVIYRDAPIRKLSGYVSLRTVATLLAAFPFLIYGLQAATWRMETPSSDPDFFAAMEYVRDNREDGDAIIVSLPTTAHFAFDQATIKNDLYFLAGPEERSRSNRYTRPLADGSRVDYWLGMPSIVSTGQLCEVLASHGDRTWFIVDEDRLNASWAYRGPMSEVIQGSSKLVAQGQGGSRVFRVRPLSEWSEKASKHCTTIQVGTPAPVDAATPAPR